MTDFSSFNPNFYHSSYQTNFQMALKRQINDLKEDVRVKDEELLILKRDMRNTKHAEFEAENSILMNELVRLRAIIDQLFAQMNQTSENDGGENGDSAPDNGSPNRKDSQKDEMIQNLLQANQQFQKVDQEKDHRIMELQEIVQELDDKFSKKNSALTDAKRNHTKLIKAKNKEIQKLKQQVEEAGPPKGHTPGTNKSFEAKQSKEQSKETITKLEKELTRVKTDLKKYKEEFTKAKSKIGDLEDKTDAQYSENKELQRQVNNYKSKFDLFKRKEEALQEQVYQLQNTQGLQSDKSKDSHVKSELKNQNFNVGSLDKFQKLLNEPSEAKSDVPDMKPIIADESKNDAYGDEFNFDDDNYGQSESQVQPQPHNESSQQHEKIETSQNEQVESNQNEQNDVGGNESDEGEYGIFNKESDLKSDSDALQQQTEDQGQPQAQSEQQEDEDPSDEEYGQDDFENVQSPKNDEQSDDHANQGKIL